MKADFGVRRLLASGRMLIGSCKPSRARERAAAAASEIYSPPKARFRSDPVRRRQPQIVLERLSLVLSLKQGIIWGNKQSIAI